MSVFDVMPRAGVEPASHLVGRFDYLNASARGEAQHVRNLLDAWFADYPEANQDEMRRRLRSRDDTLHRSAHFELFLHALLRQQGFTIVAVEPALPNGRQPDFLVEAPDGTRFYLEATLAPGMAAVDAGADRRMREALQAIDDVVSPNFFLHLETRGTPDQPVAVGRLRRSVQTYVDGLDHAAAVQAIAADQPVAAPWEYETHGAHFRIEPVPKNTPGFGRAVGARVLAGGFIRLHAPIKSAVEGKAGRYGVLDHPLVVAVNALEEYVGPDDAVDALFGTTAVVVPEGGPPRHVRNSDGVWQGPDGPVYTRLSAVLFVERLSAWSVAQRTARLILNPWATNPPKHIPLGIEIRHVVENKLVIQTGAALHAIFGLSVDWPEGG